MHNLVDVAQFLAVQVPDDGDLVNSANNAVPHQNLADRTRLLFNRGHVIAVESVAIDAADSFVELATTTSSTYGDVASAFVDVLSCAVGDVLLASCSCRVSADDVGTQTRVRLVSVEDFGGAGIETAISAARALSAGAQTFQHGVTMGGSRTVALAGTARVKVQFKSSNNMDIARVASPLSLTVLHLRNVT